MFKISPRCGMPNGQIEDHYHLFQAIDNICGIVLPAQFYLCCPTEMIALYRAMPAFKAKHEVVTVSVTHIFLTSNGGKHP